MSITCILLNLVEMCEYFQLLLSFVRNKFFEPHSKDNLKTNMTEKTFFYIKLLFAIIDGTQGIPNNICKNGGKYAKSNCESIFVWNKDHANFMSLFNVALLNNHTHNSNSLRGKTVRVIADNMLPYITSSNYSQKLGGFLGDVWQLIESAFEFKSNVSSIHFDTGLEIITSGKADVMLGAVVQKEDLLNVMYSQPYFYNWYHLFIKMPKPKASSTSYLKTFDAQLWFVTLIIFAILTMTVWLTTKFLNSVCRTKIEPTISAPSCFLGIVSGFINQGFDLKLRSSSGRMQVICALILGVVLYSAMNAVLVAQLAVFDIPFPFESLDDIANKRTHSLCLRSNSFVYNNFTDKDKRVCSKWKGILNSPPCTDINRQENLAKILCKDGLIILENRLVMETVLKEYNITCEIVNKQEKYFKTGNSFLLMKSFEYKYLIDGFVKKMRSSGILQRLEYKWTRKEKLVNINIPQSPQVTLDHIEGLLVMYFGMMLISLLVLAFEYSYFQYKRPNEYIYPREIE